VFAQINDRVNEEMAAHPEYADNVAKKYSVCRGMFWGMFGTFGKIMVSRCPSVLQEQLDTQESIVLWKFHDSRSFSKSRGIGIKGEMADTVTVMKNSPFLADEVKMRGLSKGRPLRLCGWM
jgi:amidophosphoribosyltransferase